MAAGGGNRRSAVAATERDEAGVGSRNRSSVGSRRDRFEREAGSPSAGGVLSIRTRIAWSS
jgi:hypothetical protein